MASKDGSTFFFTSESVNEGHPDKLADQVRPIAEAPTSRFASARATPTVAFCQTRDLF
jgi:S-adenosylmethionine synthetase